MNNKNRIGKLQKNINNFLSKPISYFSPTISKLAKELTPLDISGSNKIRIGTENDGGYVVTPEAFLNSEIMMSYGIDRDITFEMQTIENYKLKVYAFDGGVKAEDFETHPNLSIFEECIGNDEFLYSQQESSNKVRSYEQQLKAVNASNKKVFLKMDIEGAEYEAIESIKDELLKNIQGIVIELHGIKFIKNHKKILKLIKKLNQYFIIYHVHGNNFARNLRFFPNKTLPHAIELSLINKDLVDSHSVSKEVYPTKLDMPNHDIRPELKFRYW